MKEIVVNLIIIIGVLIMFGSVYYILGYGSDYKVATENLIQRLDLAEEKLATCSTDLEFKKKSNDECWEFTRDRCVCVYYDAGGTSSLTKEEICNGDWGYYISK